MREWTRTAAPETEPITAAELNTFLGTGFSVTGEGEEPSEAETKLGPVIREARALAERWSGRSFLTQSWRLSMEARDAGLLCRVLKFLHGPVSAITVVGVVAPGETDPEEPGEGEELPCALREGRDEAVLKAGESWPVVTGEDLLVVAYDTGVEDAEDLDPDVVRLVKELAALLWRHRGDGFVQGAESFLDNPDVAKLLAKFKGLQVDGLILAS